MNNEDMPISINLIVWDGGIGVNYLTRRIGLDEYGEVERGICSPNPNADFDEQTIRLLEDTLKGMQVILNRIKKYKKDNA